MSDEDFCAYLKKIGLLSNIDALNRNKNIVFALADYIKQMTPSDAYDTAARMKKCFLSTPQTNPLGQLSTLIKFKAKSQIADAFQELKIQRKNKQPQSHYQFDAGFSSPSQSYHTASDKKKRDYLSGEYRSVQQRLYANEITQHEAQSLIQEINKKHQTKDCTFKPNINSNSNLNNNRSFKDSSVFSTENTIHDRLYEEGLQKQMTKDKLKQLRNELEMVECTFKPQLSNSSLPQRRNDEPIHSRLHKTQLLSHHDWSDLQAKQELKGCTFNPQTSFMSNSNDNSTFDRLYKEAESRSKCQEYNEVVKSNMQLKDCTFHPRVNSASRIHNSARDSDENSIREQAYLRLHRENEKKQRNLLQKQQESQKQLTSGCTFRPQINSSSKRRQDENHQPAHERLYQMFEDRKRSKEQQEILSEKRQNSQQQTPVNQNNNSGGETSLIKRMKDFADKKRRNLQMLETNIRKEQGITFNPQINRDRKGRSRSTSRRQTSAQKSNRPPLTSTKSAKQSKDYDTTATYCETAYFNVESGKKLNTTHQLSQHYSGRPKLFDSRGSGHDEMFSLESNLLQQLDTDTREKYMNLQIGT